MFGRHVAMEISSIAQSFPPPPCALLRMEKVALVCEGPVTKTKPFLFQPSGCISPVLYWSISSRINVRLGLTPGFQVCTPTESTPQFGQTFLTQALNS